MQFHSPGPIDSLIRPSLRLCLAVIVLFCPQYLAGQQPPNIVLIMADDLGYECLSCNGSVSYRTPQLDRLANQGVRFTNCHSQPLCTPTRNQIMTGKYNFRNYENFEYLDPKQKTFAHLLKSAGYQTCIAGKWQLNGRGWRRDGRQNSSRPKAAGFDSACLWQVTGLGKRYRDAALEINGEWKEFPGQYGPDICVDFISQFIQKNKSGPFLIYYPMILTHSPFVPTPSSEDWNSEKPKKNRQHYFGEMVEYMDKLVGRLEGCLKKNGVLDNTIFIFTGDNGTTRGLTTETRAGAVAGAKGMTLDTGTHVPLIVSWPRKGARSSVCDDLIDFTDVLPTLVDAVDGELPNDFLCDGQSFFPQITGEKGKPREYIYCFYDPVHSKNVNQFRNRFARDKKWKLYRDGQLFNVQKDPLEKSPIDSRQLSPGDKKQVDFLESIIDRYDSEGAERAAKLLAKKVRPPSQRK